MPVEKETVPVTQVEHEIKEKSIDDINAQKEVYHTKSDDAEEGDKNENASTEDIDAISQSGDTLLEAADNAETVVLTEERREDNTGEKRSTEEENSEDESPTKKVKSEEQKVSDDD